MRRIVTATLSLSIALSLMLTTGGTASANALAGGGYSSSYAGESVFTNKAAGEAGQFSAIFFNDGTRAWAPGIVGLLVCLSDKTTCNVASPNAAYASGWQSTTVYASVSAGVNPGQNGFFIYNFTVPAGTGAGVAATFNGDVGLIASGLMLRPEGYYQVNTTPAATGALTISPTSTSQPVGGQQQFTATGAPAGSTVSWTVTGGCGAVTNTGLFAATAVNSSTQPCSVVASASGLTASASITVFGAATQIICTSSKTTVTAGASTSDTFTITATLKDSSNNTVANDSATSITFTNNTPTLLTARGTTPDQDSATAEFQRTAQSGVALSAYYPSTSTGTGVISVSSGSLTGCTQSITIQAAGSAAKLVVSFYPGTISADGSSNALVEVDVTDANGVVISSDSSTSVTLSRDTGSAVCNISSGGSGGPTTVTSGVAYFSVTSTSTPGTCTWTASTGTTGISTGSATLTTVLSGSANKLAVVANASPKSADGVATLRVTVQLQDANGNPLTTSASQVTVTATLGTNCYGTKADASTGYVTFSDGTTAAKTSTSGAFSAYSGAVGEDTGYARFIFKSSFATTCTVTYSGSGVSSATADITFNAAGAATIACRFNPSNIISDGSSTAIGTISVVDNNNNLATTSGISVAFSGTGAYTTQLTTSPQTTSSGIAQYTVKSSSATANGTDTYTATATVSGTTRTTTCTITVSDTLGIY
jgi:hypothetical protein